MNYTVIGCEEAKKLTGWSTDMDQEYHGVVPGYLCGYNFEVTNKEGITDFCSATFKPYTPDKVMEHDYYADFLNDLGLNPTGRVIFRGYFSEMYDPYERDYYVEPVNYEDIKEASNELC